MLRGRAQPLHEVRQLGVIGQIDDADLGPAQVNTVGTTAVPGRGRPREAVLDRGVLIRETGPSGWLRVTVGTPEEMAAFRSALDEVLI